MRADATYFQGSLHEPGELWLDQDGLSFYRKTRSGGFTYSLAGMGFNMSTRSERALLVPWREILDVYVPPDWPLGFCVQTPFGQLAFGVTNPQGWVVEIVRQR
jgi:hypothetical protein